MHLCYNSSSDCLTATIKLTSGVLSGEHKRLHTPLPSSRLLLTCLFLTLFFIIRCLLVLLVFLVLLTLLTKVVYIYRLPMGTLLLW